jgi:hypothetical protein
MKSVILEREIHAELTRGKSDFVAVARHLHLMEYWHNDQCLAALISAGIERSFQPRVRSQL